MQDLSSSYLFLRALVLPRRLLPAFIGAIVSISLFSALAPSTSFGPSSAVTTLANGAGHASASDLKALGWERLRVDICENESGAGSCINQHGEYVAAGSVAVIVGKGNLFVRLPVDIGQYKAGASASINDRGDFVVAGSSAVIQGNVVSVVTERLAAAERSPDVSIQQEREKLEKLLAEMTSARK